MKRVTRDWVRPRSQSQLLRRHDLHGVLPPARAAENVRFPRSWHNAEVKDQESDLLRVCPLRAWRVLRNSLWMTPNVLLNIPPFLLGLSREVDVSLPFQERKLSL